MIHALVGDNHEMRFGALFHIRQLASQQALEFFHRHAGPAQRPGALNFRRGAGHHHRIHLNVRSGFKQKRNIQNHHRFVFGPGQKSLAFRRHQRMHQRFQFFQGPRIAHDRRRQRRPVHRAIPHYAGKKLGDFRHRRATFGIKLVDHRIGIMHRHTFGGEKPRGLAFAHGERAGQPDDERLMRHALPRPAPRAGRA